MFWVISVYFNIRNTLPNSGTFLLGHSVYLIRFLTDVLSSSGRDCKLTIHKMTPSSGFHFGNSFHQCPIPFPEGKIPQRIFNKEYSCGGNYVGREGEQASIVDGKRCAIMFTCGCLVSMDCHNLWQDRQCTYNVTLRRANVFDSYPAHPNPLVRSIGNYSLADLHRQYKKYIHKRPKHLFL